MFLLPLLPLLAGRASAQEPPLAAASAAPSPPVFGDGSPWVGEGGCRVPLSALAERASRADAAWLRHDLTAFAADVAVMETMVPCVTEPVTAELAAQIHILVALARVTSRDREAALAQMRALPRGFVPSREMVPEGQFLAGMFAEAAALPERDRVPVPMPRGWRLRVDGTLAVDRPDGAAVLQVARPDGTMVWNGMGPPMPAHYPELDSVPTPEPLPSEPVTEVPPRSIAPVVATLVASGIGLGGLGLGLANRGTFEDPGTPYEEIAGLQERSVVYTGVAIGGAALAAAGAAWWVVEW